MNWHYGYIILCHLLPSVYLNSPRSTQTHRSLCHAHKASAQGSQCLPFPSFLFLLFCPSILSVCLCSPGTWSWSLAIDRSSTALQHRFKGNHTTIIKEVALENEVCSLAFRLWPSSFLYKKIKEVLDQKSGKERKRWGNKWCSADGCYLLALSWDRGGAREEQTMPVLCSAELSLLHFTFSCVSKWITAYFKVT